MRINDYKLGLPTNMHVLYIEQRHQTRYYKQMILFGEQHGFLSSFWKTILYDVYGSLENYIAHKYAHNTL